MHVQTNETIAEQHGTTRLKIIEVIQVTEQNSEAVHSATQLEITNLIAAIQQLSDDIKLKDAELRDLLKAFCKTKSLKKKKKLQEQGNAISATLLALETM